MMRHCGTARLETERLILRKFVPEDAEYMFRNASQSQDDSRMLYRIIRVR